MANRTPIEWCRTYAADGSFTEGYSVNPVRFRPHGSERLTTMCQKVSPGCSHCYAEGITRRFWPKDAAVPFPGYTALGVVSGEFVIDEKMLLSVMKIKEPARVFWGDMTDLFQASIPDQFLDRCFAVAALTPHLTHMFLTKRPERAKAYLGAEDRPVSIADAWADWFDMRKDLDVAVAKAEDRLRALDSDGSGNIELKWPLPNVWLGTSVENQAEADKRIPELLATPAAVRFISAEPLLGSVSVAGSLRMDHKRCTLCARIMSAVGYSEGSNAVVFECECGNQVKTGHRLAYLQGVDWVICGGESGSGARPMHPDWARGLRDQCVAAGVPYFFKQNGEFASVSEVAGAGHHHHFLDGTTVRKVGKKAAGDLLDGKRWHQFPGTAPAVRGE